MNDYYTVLGIETNATKEEIKEAYRFLATQLHPDKHQGQGAKIAEKKIKEINEAYEVLSDNTKRAHYDNTNFDSYSRNTSSHVHNQRWTASFGDGQYIYVLTVITTEQFKQIVRANEATYDYVLLQFNDRSKINFGEIISGTMPKFNGHYCLSKKHLPKSSYSSASFVFGNTQTGELVIRFILEDVFLLYNELYKGIPNCRSISLRHNWNEYTKVYNQFIKLVNGE
jgi:curved DNA-binding protein CbpA